MFVRVFSPGEGGEWTWRNHSFRRRCALNPKSLTRFVKNPFSVSKVAKARWLDISENLKLESLSLALTLIQTKNQNHLEDGSASRSQSSQREVPRPAAAAAAPENFPEVQTRKPCSPQAG